MVGTQSMLTAITKTEMITVGISKEGGFDVRDAFACRVLGPAPSATPIIIS